MRIEFDPAKDAINRREHEGLSLAVAEEFTADALVVPTYSGSDRVRYKMIDVTSEGLLAAIVTPRHDKMRIISLRYANRKERKLYADKIRTTER
ncbi:MAG: BrnT family toxin [Acidobacteriaceae bacterium]|nr:BrnT family toxin [Acidobacteriaceae bacterium]